MVLKISEIQVTGEEYFFSDIQFNDMFDLAKKGIAEIIKDRINPKLIFTFRDLPEDDPAKRLPDIQLAKSKLNWEPSTSFKQGLEPTIEWFKNMKV